MNIGKYLQVYSEELQRKGYRKNSIDNYVSYTKVFLERHNKIVEKPTEINEQHIKDFLRSFKEHNTQRAYHSAIKAFYKYVVKQPNKFKYVEYCKRSRKLPIVLSAEEVEGIVKVANSKHRAIILLMFSCGLRVGEVINLKITDIDSKREVIYIRNAKGGKDRQVPLHAALLEHLRAYYKEWHPKEYLFNGQFSGQYTESSIRQFLKKYALETGITKRIYPHLLRHSSLTNMLEGGVDISVIQNIAGHQNINTTRGYTHVSNVLINRVYNPITSLNLRS